MRKKFFPGNAKHSYIKGQLKPRHASRRLSVDVINHQGKNLRSEFDLRMRETHIHISDEQLDQEWRKVSSLLLKDPGLSLQEAIIGTQ
jgi:D-lyxose ketol-isomerase